MTTHSRPTSLPLQALKALTALLVVVALGWVLYEQRQLLEKSLSMRGADAALLIALTLCSWLVNSYSQGVMLRALGHRLSWSELFALHAGAGLLNHLPLRPGIAYRAQHFKRRLGLDYTAFGTLFGVNFFVMVCAAGALGAGTLMVHSPATLGDATRTITIVAFLAIGAAGVLPLLVPLPALPEPLGRLSRIVERVRGARDAFRQHRGTLPFLFGCQLVLFSLGAWRLSIAFETLGMDVGWSACIVFGSMSTLAIFASITPAGLGVQEFTIGTLGLVLGVGFMRVTVAATVVRAFYTLTYAVVGGLSMAALKTLPSLQADASLK